MRKTVERQRFAVLLFSMRLTMLGSDTLGLVRTAFGMSQRSPLDTTIAFG